MTDLAIGDYALIVKQPKNQNAFLVGQVGYIESMDEHYCIFVAINYGTMYGTGVIPKSNLVKIEREEAIAISFRK